MRVHRGAVVPVVLSFVLSATGVARAQSAPVTPGDGAVPVAVQGGDTLEGGLKEGELLANSQRVGPKMGTGVVVGVLTGFIGTGIGYFLIGPSPLSDEALKQSVGKSPDFQLGLRTGWERKTRSHKRTAFLIGGMIGTAAWIAIYAAAGDGRDGY